MTQEVYAPKGRYAGRHKAYCTVYRDWNKLCQNRPGPIRRCYIELADNPFPRCRPTATTNSRGKLKGFWASSDVGRCRERDVLASSSREGRVVVWDLATGEVMS